MIIKKVVINSFGGLSKTELEFTNGMNIVIGPNESGKSTIFNAIENILFTKSDLTTTKFRKLMGPFLPIGGGDTIEAILYFIGEGKEYMLNRAWGSARSSILTLPDGHLITDDATIQEEIEKSLRVSEGTCKTVMLTYQSGLVKTLDEVRKNTETLETLGDVLRKTVMEMDGISVDAFKSNVESLYNIYFSKWDIEAEYPMNNRGIENPYKKELGKIIASFYEKEKIRKELDNAKDYESNLDNLNKGISECARELLEADVFVKKNKNARDDAAKKKQLEAELEAIKLNYEKISKINKDWPVAENITKELESKIPILESKAHEFHKEKEEVNNIIRNKELVEKYTQAKSRKELLERVEDGLKSVRKITSHDLKKIRLTISARQSLESSLSSRKLFLEFDSAKRMDLRIQKGIEDEEQCTIEPGKTLDISADGIIQLKHADWSAIITLGERDYEEILAEYHDTANEEKMLMEKHDIKTIDEAEDVNSKYQEELNKVDAARLSFKELLGEDTYEVLEAKAKDLEFEKPKRTLELVIEELVETNNEIDNANQKLNELEEKLSEYIEDYGDQDRLLIKISEITRDQEDKRKELNGLAPLPEGEGDFDQFIKKYDELDRRLKELKDKMNSMVQEKIRLEGDSPDRSVEEFEKDLVEVEERFNSQLREGKAVARIKETMHSLLQEMDEETYLGLESDVERMISVMTIGRYEKVSMDESIPNGFQRKDGGVIPYDKLSKGTQDVLAIALRLALAKKFLEDKEGFVIMDDPLVDLDPERQIKAADVMKDFAIDKQVIIFSCHPSHAKMLGGRAQWIG
ncbi:AAA family ATPase [Thermodesulfobacteriota bacterium]